MPQFPCPYVHPNGEQCPGHIVKVEAFNADLHWTFDGSGNWTFNHSQPRSQYHLFCSERGNHADDRGAEQMQCYTINFPDELLVVIIARAEQPESDGPTEAPDGPRDALTAGHDELIALGDGASQGRTEG